MPVPNNPELIEWGGVRPRVLGIRNIPQMLNFTFFFSIP